jgi:hypothetical protein
MKGKNKQFTTEEEKNELVSHYIEHSYKATTDSLNSLNTRLTTLIGFSGILLRFTIDLPEVIIHDFQLTPVIKIIVSIILFLVILFLIIGLFPKASGAPYTGQELLDKLSQKDTYNECVKFIILHRDKTIEDIDKLRFQKTNNLKISNILIVISIFLFALDIVLSSCVPCSNTFAHHLEQLQYSIDHQI